MDTTLCSIFSVSRSLKPDLTGPPDFDSFWQKTLSELSDVPIALQRSLRDGSKERNLCLEDLTFDSLEGVSIRGYALYSRDDKPRPVVIHSHGYGSACEVGWEWALAGFQVVGVDIRGFGRSGPAFPSPSRHGYILSGIETPETSVIRGAVCDYIRAVEAAAELFDLSSCSLVLHGVSFAGGLATMAEALIQKASLLAVGVPTFGWAEGRNFFVKSGSGAEISQYLEQRPDMTEDAMLVLRYFDPINLAGRITCPALVGVGLSDDVVPAKTVYAIANHLSGPYEIMEFPVSHSDLPEEKLWEGFEKRWMDLALNGIPENFGKS